MGDRHEGKLHCIGGAYVFITGLYQKDVDIAVSDIGKNVSGIQGAL
jgi:hypothetical protein